MKYITIVQIMSYMKPKSKKKENEEMNVFGQKIDADAIRAKINLKNFIFTQRSSCV